MTLVFLEHTGMNEKKETDVITLIGKKRSVIILPVVFMKKIKGYKIVTPVFQLNAYGEYEIIT